ncbi:hypothetical protein PVAP13_4NG062416 [Panicum virgatum]|uniref:Uncharacterized protein n=1 Tax=Panicum virgatum TaxID=38727 RepID=A0A8T0T012_PANVG|nr:hypothetical protein PVAP13_4NG062416 [Panicum virgatum]
MRAHIYTCSGAHAGVSRAGDRPHRRRRGGAVDLGGAGGQIRRGNKQGADRVSGARGTRPRARCPPVAPHARPPPAGRPGRTDGLAWWGRGVGAAAARHGMASARLAAAGGGGCAVCRGRGEWAPAGSAKALPSERASGWVWVSSGPCARARRVRRAYM